MIHNLDFSLFGGRFRMLRMFRHTTAILVMSAAMSTIAFPVTELDAQRQLRDPSVPPQTFVMRFAGPAVVSGAVVPDALRQRISISLTRVTIARALTEIADQGGFTLLYSRDVVPVDQRVSVHVSNETVADALIQALRGLPLELLVSSTGQMALVSSENPRSRTDARNVGVAGVIVGQVTDAVTTRPISGATVLLDGASRNVVTGQDGRFRISTSAGTHALGVRALGYQRTQRTVVVEDGSTLAVDLALTPSVNALDQVVVTGTVTPTEVKAIPNAITVITAKDIEQRGITKIDQLLRGDVAGVFAQDAGSAAPAGETSVYTRGSTRLNGTSDPIKTYVDGIELVDPSLLNAIDPASIERIEILSGPQASTIYGSAAINGVMQIFTKKGGTSTRHVTATVTSGLVENNLSSSLAPQHDHTLQVEDVSGRLSVVGTASYSYLGQWTPGYFTQRPGGSLGLRMRAGNLAAEGTGRLARFRVGAISAPAVYTARQASGLYKYSASAGGINASDNVSDQTTLGAKFAYTAWSRWQQTFMVGRDESDRSRITRRPSFSAPRDSMLSVNTGTYTKTSISYNTAFDLMLPGGVHPVITLGLDQWRSLSNSLIASSLTGTGTLTAQSVQRNLGRNAGYFGQAQIGIRDVVFLTYGLRVEDNPNYGDEYGLNFSPRYGVSLVYDIGMTTVKLRGAYGRATRPPNATAKEDDYDRINYGGIDFGEIVVRRGNPVIGPEFQRGGEGGIDLAIGNLVTVQLTRYNQIVDGLISFETIDSVRSPVPNAQGRYIYYPGITQYQNLGRVRNDGWETQASTTVGPLSVQGTHSWTRSRIVAIGPSYTGSQRPGDPVRGLPEHFAALTVGYSQAKTSINLTSRFTGRSITENDFLRFDASQARFTTEIARLSTFGGRYVRPVPGYTRLSLNATRSLSSTTELLLRVNNLTNQYRNDQNFQYPTMGRVTTFGARLRW